jgi:hypothetical protein
MIAEVAFCILQEQSIPVVGDISSMWLTYTQRVLALRRMCQSSYTILNDIIYQTYLPYLQLSYVVAAQLSSCQDRRSDRGH